ncbi:MAG: serine/threonine-protein kinase [Myxococcota bacterium]
MNSYSPQQQGSGRDMVGRRIFGQYSITKKLGEGGMGAVYLARQEAIDQEIAIKVLLKEAARSPEIVQRFHREAKVISMLTHPNIIRVFIFGRTEDGLLYLAMEFVKGHELREELRGQPMEELVAIRIMKQACSALQEAHDLGVIHRDLKPDNILLTKFRGEDRFVKILDFGIAKLKDNSQAADGAKLTQAGIVYGTPEYLSPEQAQAFELDHRTDIYSLGIMLFEMMVGRVPFSGDSPVKILTKHVFEEPPRPNAIANGRIAPTMEDLIMKAMDKDREKRFDSALDMFRALVRREQELLSERGLGADANWVPGGELTGMFQAITGAEAALLSRSNSLAQQPQRTPMFNPQQPLSSGQQPAEQRALTMDMQSPSSFTAQPAANPSDPTRKLILAVIGVGVIVLVVLIFIIAYLLVTK